MTKCYRILEERLWSHYNLIPIAEQNAEFQFTRIFAHFFRPGCGSDLRAKWIENDKAQKRSESNIAEIWLYFMYYPRSQSNKWWHKQKQLKSKI